MMFDLTNDRKSMKSLIGQKKKKNSSHKDMIMHFSGLCFMDVLCDENLLELPIISISYM